MHAPHSRVPIVQWFSGCEGVCFSVDAHMIPMPHAACAQRCQIPVHWALKWPQMQGKIAPMFFVTTLPFFPTLLESYHSHQESVNFLVVIHFKVAHFADMGKMCVIKCECVCVYSSLKFVGFSLFKVCWNRSDHELATKFQGPRFLPISTIVNFWKNPQLCQEKITRWLFHFVFHMKAYMLHVTLGNFSGWWFLRFAFKISPRKLGKIPILTSIFFKRVGSTTNYIDNYLRSETFGNLSPLWSSVSNFIDLTSTCRRLVSGMLCEVFQGICEGIPLEAYILRIGLDPNSGAPDF